MRKVEVTPEVEAEALVKLATCGFHRSPRSARRATRAHWQRVERSPNAPRFPSGRRWLVVDAPRAAAVEPGSVTDLRGLPIA